MAGVGFSVPTVSRAIRSVNGMGPMASPIAPSEGLSFADLMRIQGGRGALPTRVAGPSLTMPNALPAMDVAGAPSIWSAGPSTIPSSVPTVGNPDIARLIQSRVSGQPPGLSAAQWQPIASQAEAAGLRNAQALAGGLNPNLASLPRVPADPTMAWASQNGLNWSQLRPSAPTSTPGVTAGMADAAGAPTVGMFAPTGASPAAAAAAESSIPTVGMFAPPAADAAGAAAGAATYTGGEFTGLGGLFKGMFGGQMERGPLAGLSGPLAEDAGYMSKFGKSATSGLVARTGLSLGLPYLGDRFANEFNQRGMTQAAQEATSLGRVAGMAGGFGGVPGAIAAVPAYVGTELMSNNQFGNDVLNTVRGSRTGVDINTGKDRDINPLANYASLLNPLTAGAGAINRLAQLTGLVDKGREATADTASDVLGAGGASAAKAAVVTPEQRLALSSPDALAKVTSDYKLDPAMSTKLLENYRKSVVLATAQGGVQLQVGQDGKLADGSSVDKKANVRKVTDDKGNAVYISSDPADIQEAVYTRSLQEIPLLAQQQSQEEDYMRKQALMQAQLEEAIPQYFGGASWAADPTAQMLAAASIRDIPSRYVQAQSMQTQQGINSQIQQAQIQQMLAQQYPELFGRQSSSQPATLDAAINNG